MDQLNNFNLLHSNIVVGMHANINKTLDIIESFNIWNNHKKLDLGFQDYIERNIIYTGYLKKIDLFILKEVFNDLASIYKRSFPHSNKQDFINYTFGYTLFDLEQFYSREFRFLGSPKLDSPIDYYYCYDHTTGEVVEFALAENQKILEYKQYYKKVINLIQEVPWNKKSIFEKYAQGHDTSTSKKKEKLLSSVPKWATAFYYADNEKLTPESSTKKERMILFMEQHNIETTLKYFKSSYHDAAKKLNQKRYPVEKLESILPFLEDHYPATIKTVESDIELLEIENPKNY